MLATTKHILTKSFKQFLVVIFLPSLAMIPTSAAAADINISTSITTPQALTEDNQKLTIESGGNLAVTSFMATYSSEYTGLQIELNSLAGSGISTSGNSYSAIGISGTGTLSSLVLNSGTITSDLSGSGATVSLAGNGGETGINLAADSIISNSATAGYTINSNTDSDTILTITNAGSISANNNADSVAINFGDSDGGSTLNVGNTGIISAGASGTAINLATDDSTVSINNTGAGAITGAISLRANNSSITNDTSSGGITGNITATEGNLNVTNNAGSITGNIDLGTISSSSVTMNGGTITGNLTLRNSNQIITFGGGALDGTINGYGKVVVDTASYVLNGNIGASDTIASLTINSGNTLNAATNNNSISATDISLASNSALTLGTGALTATVDGSSTAVGAVSLNGTNTLASGTLLGSTNGLAAVTVGNGAVITANDSIKATTLTVGGGTSGSLSLAASKSITGNAVIASGATLTLNNASSVSGTINGASSGVGTLSIGSSSTVTAGSSNIGLTNALNTISLASGATFNTQSISGTISATTVSLASTSILNLGSVAVTGTIQGASDGVGTVNFNSSTSLLGNVGTSANSLLRMTVAANRTVAAGSNNIDATTISLGSGSSLSLSTGTVTGTVQGTSDGVGAVNILQNFTANGNLGTVANSLSTVLVSSSRTLNLATNSNNIDASIISLGSNSVLTLGSGTVTGSIQGSSAGNGTVNFTQNFSSNGNVGSLANGLSAISISADKTLNLSGNNNSLYADLVTLNVNSVLTLGSGSLSGAIDGSAEGVGTVNLNGSNSLEEGTLLGSSNGLAAVTVGNDAEITANDSIKATTLTVGGGTSGSLALATNKSITGNVVIANGASFTLGNTSSVSGTINASSAGVGTLNIGADSAVTTTADIGSTNSLAAISLAENSFLDAASNNSVIVATTISLATDSILSLGSGTLTGVVQGSSDGVGTVNLTRTTTLASGTLLGSSNSLAAVTVSNGATITANDSIKVTTLTIGGGTSGSLSLSANKSITGNAVIASGATLTLNDSSSVSGAINGSSSGVGTLNISGSSVTVGGNIGATHSLSSLAISSGSSFTANGNIFATNVALAGTLSLGNSSRIIGGNLTGSGTATINAAQGSHNVTGTFSTASGDTLAVGVASSSSAGSITSSGIATIASGTNLALTIDTGVAVASGSTYNIVSGGSGSSINAISSSDIGINGSSSNRYGVIVFNTVQSGDNLVLSATKQAAAFSASSSTSQSAFNAVNDVDGASAQLLTMQNYINADSTNNSQREEAAQSISPQADNSSNRTSFSVATASVNVAENRLGNLRAGVSSGDEAVSKGIWIQGFGGTAKQDSNSQSDGYNSRSTGFSIGMDKEILEDSNVGISLSQTSSNVKSNVGLKTIAIDSYQANIYGSVNMDEYFVNGLAGLALNRYSSNRAISLVGANATANYSGKTYIAKVTSGTVKNLGNGFNLTPAVTLTYAHNQSNKYSESGAGTLNLAVATKSAQFFEGRIGSDLNYNFLTAAGTRINPAFSLSYGYDFVGAKQNSTSNFVGQTTTFTSTGANVYQGSIKAGLALNIFRIDAITIGLAYEHEHRTNYQANSGSARLKYEF